jgi:cysteine-rich repeat protein
MADLCALCGNGTVEGDEVCDDGNLLAGDACSPCCAETWYVSSSGNDGNNGCTESTPFETFANLDGAGPSDWPGHTIVILDSTIPGNLTLEESQTLKGNGGDNDVIDGTVTLPATGFGTTTLEDLRIEPSSGIALTGTGFGTLATAGVVTIDAQAGQGMSLSNGAVSSAEFASVSSTDSTGDGIKLNNLSGSLVIRGGTLENPDDNGILAETCTATLTFDSMTIRETGNAAVDGQDSHGARFADCTGDIRVENCAFEDMNETPSGAGSGLDNNGIHVENRLGGTLGSLQIIDCEFHGTVSGGVGTTTDHGVKIVLDNESKITDADITGCLATGLGRGFVEVNADIDDDGDDCSIGDLNISNNGTAANPLEAQSEVIQLRVAGTSDVTFHVDNNVMEDSANGHSQGNGIRINSGEFNVGTFSTATITGTIYDNDIDNLGDSGFDNGIELQVQESTTAVVEIDDNEVDGMSDDGIRCRIFDDADADLTISNNEVGKTTANVNSGIEVQTRSQLTVLTLCLDVFNNDVGAGDDYNLNQDAGTFELLDVQGVVGGGPTWTPAEVDTYLGSSGVNKNNVGTKNTEPGTYRNCTSILTP